MDALNPGFSPWNNFGEEDYADLNSFHLWLCSQSDGFDLAPNTCMTPAQQEERRKWIRLAYFGLTGDQYHYMTLDRRLPDLETPDHSSFREVLAATKRSNVDLGDLDRLPPEILACIISSLDISTVVQFKAVNRRGFEIVDTHAQFRVLNSQAHGTLRGIRAIRIGHAITVKNLFEKLCESECVECGDYGGYMYLPTLQRLCFRCFTNNDRCVPLPEKDALKRFGLTPEVLRTLPHFQNYPCLDPGRPGVQPPSGGRLYKEEEHISLVDCESARSAGIAHHGSFEAMQEYVANADSNIWNFYTKETKERELVIQRAMKMCEDRAKRKEISNKQKALRKKSKAYMMAARIRREEREKRMGNLTEEQFYWCRYWSRHKGPLPEAIKNLNENTIENINVLGLESDKNNSEQIPVNTEESETEVTSSDSSDSSDEDAGYFHLTGQERLRTTAILRVPWLNRKSRRDEWGFRCIGCNGVNQRSRHINREFIMSTFRAHLMEFGPIRGGVHHTNDCCRKGTCKTRYGGIFNLYHRPFSGC